MKKRVNVKESIGRDLVGAGRFESRKNVVAKIMKKYPTPESLAAGLEKLASKLEGRPKAKVLQLAQAAAGTSAKDYPAFVQKIAGLSKLWKYLATTAAAATIAAGATWFVKSFMQASADLDAELNGPIGATSQRLNPKEAGLSDKLERTAQHMIGDVGDAARWAKTHTPQSVKNLLSPEMKAKIRNTKFVKGLKDPAKAAKALRDIGSDTKDTIVGWFNRNKEAEQKLNQIYKNQMDSTPSLRSGAPVLRDLGLA